MLELIVGEIVTIKILCDGLLNFLADENNSKKKYKYSDGPYQFQATGIDSAIDQKNSDYIIVKTLSDDKVCQIYFEDKILQDAINYSNIKNTYDESKLEKLATDIDCLSKPGSYRLILITDDKFEVKELN